MRDRSKRTTSSRQVFRAVNLQQIPVLPEWLNRIALPQRARYRTGSRGAIAPHLRPGRPSQWFAVARAIFFSGMMYRKPQSSCEAQRPGTRVRARMEVEKTRSQNAVITP